MAITTTYDDVICIAEELTGKQPLVEKCIERAKLDVSETFWGAKANFATELLAAHYATLFSRKGSAEGVKRRRIGEAEVEYQAKSSSEGGDSAFLSTAYGKQYLDLRKSISVTPILTGC